MKTVAVFIFIVLLGLTFDAPAQVVTNQPARLKWKIVWYEGNTNSSTWGNSINFAPENIHAGNGGKDICPSRGYQHDLRWTFVGRNRDKDVYRFAFMRLTKAGSSDTITTSKEVQFDGKRMVVFEDPLHTVIMESPSAEDLEKSHENLPARAL